MVVVQEMVDRMEPVLENTKMNLTIAQTRMKEYANRSRRSETFHKGTEVLFSTKKLRVDLHLLSKLCRRWIEPYKVTKVISPMAYWLYLPLAWRIHPVFHVNALKGCNRSAEFVRVERPLSPIVIEGEEEYEVEGILRHKSKGALRQYLLSWKGYPLAEASWELVFHAEHAPLSLEDYLRQVSKSRGLR